MWKPTFLYGTARLPLLTIKVWKRRGPNLLGLREPTARTEGRETGWSTYKSLSTRCLFIRVHRSWHKRARKLSRSSQWLARIKMSARLSGWSTWLAYTTCPLGLSRSYRLPGWRLATWGLSRSSRATTRLQAARRAWTSRSRQVTRHPIQRRSHINTPSCTWASIELYPFVSYMHCKLILWRHRCRLNLSSFLGPWSRCTKIFLRSQGSYSSSPKNVSAGRDNLQVENSRSFNYNYNYYLFLQERQKKCKSLQCKTTVSLSGDPHLRLSTSS